MDDHREAVLRELIRLLHCLGEANDAEDRRFTDVAERMRSESCRRIGELLAVNPFVETLLPDVRRHLQSGTILDFHWSTLVEAVEKVLRGSREG